MPREYLLFRLSGPLSAWGEIAVGERRSSWPRPSKSAVLGLVAAALGYDRHDAPAHTALNDGLNFAVRVDTPLGGLRGGFGVDDSLKPLRDYHTAQVPSQDRKKHWPTRAAELSEKKLNTILSERWYWINMTATVALWTLEEGLAPPVVEIAGALEHPVFALYLGRKSCPLGRPLFPQILGANGLRKAFGAYDTINAVGAVPYISTNRKSVRDAVAIAAGSSPGSSIWTDLDGAPKELRQETQSRRDAIRDRRSWTFSDRAEARIAMGGAPDVSLES